MRTLVAWKDAAPRFLSFRHRGGGGNKKSTSLDALREVCRITHENAPREAKLHEGSASLVRFLESSFLHFTRNAIPNAAMATFSSPPTHAGNLYASPSYRQDETIIPHHGGVCKREFEIINLY